MPEQRMENFIAEVLSGETQQNALEFAAFLRANEMLFVRGKGYWEDKLYWVIKYRDEYVCFIFIIRKKLLGKMLTSAEIVAVATNRGEAAKLYSERNLITSVALL